MACTPFYAKGWRVAIAAFAAFILTNGGLSVRPIQAADLPAAEAQIEAALRRTLRTGLPALNGQPALEPAIIQAQAELDTGAVADDVLIGIVQLDAAARIRPGVNPATPVGAWNNRTQPALADLPTFTVGNVAQANTAIQAIRTSHNALLARLRAAGILSP